MSWKVFGIGEVLWDLLPNGRKLGGAPANFAYHARALGADAACISRVGEDALGRELLRQMSEVGLPTEFTTTDSVHPTGTVSVVVEEDGQPHFTIHEGVAWDYMVPDSKSVDAVSNAAVVCFGTLAQRSPTSRETIRALLDHAPEDALRICDVNLRQHFYSAAVLDASLQLANVLRLNETELPLIAELLCVPGAPRQQLGALRDAYDLRVVVLTRAEKGSILFDGEQWVESEGAKVEVVDAVGAGDAFTAATALGLLAGWPLEAISTRANEVAAFVCGHEGATPAMPAHFSFRHPTSSG
jgi:fructokinase